MSQQVGYGTSLASAARPLAGRIGAVLDTVDLREPIGATTVDELHELLADKGVVIFTDQRLDVAGHVAFARRLGTIRRPPEYFPTLRDDGHPEVGVLRSQPGWGNGADTWHADVTWSARPPRYSIAHMQLTPDAGGDTMWASLVEAYERLSLPMRRFIHALTAEHAMAAGTGANDIDRSTVHPVVHRHPVSGRLALSVSPTFTRRIIELEAVESEAVLELLFDLILRPESTCRWHWRPGDVAVWDNHFVLHYAINDYGDAPRLLHRIEIEGEPLLPATGDRPAR
jgi:taurine dioxygenase